MEISLIELKENLQEIEKLGCNIDSLPTYDDVKGIVKMRANINYKNWKQKHINKRVRNRLFRREFFKTEYNNYLSAIARFILDIYKTKSDYDASFCKIIVIYFKQNVLLLIHTNHTLLVKAIVQNI